MNNRCETFLGVQVDSGGFFTVLYLLFYNTAAGTVWTNFHRCRESPIIYISIFVLVFLSPFHFVSLGGDVDEMRLFCGLRGPKYFCFWCEEDETMRGKERSCKTWQGLAHHHTAYRVV